MSFFQDSDPITDFVTVGRPLALELYLVGDAVNKMKDAEECFSQTLRTLFEEFKSDAPVDENPFFQAWARALPTARFLEKQEVEQLKKHFDRVKDFARAEKQGKDAVRKAKNVMAVRTIELFVGDDLTAMRFVQILVRRIAMKHTLAIVDRFSNVIYNYDDPALNTFAKFDSEPVSLKHFFTVYQSGDSRAMTSTAGLNALDMPEFCIEDTEMETRHCVSYLLHGAAQALIEQMPQLGENTEGPEIKIELKLPLAISNVQMERGLPRPSRTEESNPTRITTLPLKIRKRADGPYFILDLPNNRQARDQALREIYTEIGLLEPIVYISSSDDEMKEAEKQAKAQWPEARRMFMANEGQLHIKRAFETAHGDEFMWTEVEEINGPTVRGKLQSLPPVDCRFKQYQIIDSDEKSIIDWIFFTHSGKELGGFTQQVLLKSQKM